MERRKRDRRDFLEYMRVMNENTGELVGHLADISPSGFKLESQKPIPPNTDFPFRIELAAEVADKTFMVFVARSKWCQPDQIDPTLYNVGFEITNMSPEDFEIFKNLFEKYGSQKSDKKNSNADYLWR